jgi:hypothetical protein
MLFVLVNSPLHSCVILSTGFLQLHSLQKGFVDLTELLPVSFVWKKLPEDKSGDKEKQEESSLTHISSYIK